MFNGSLRLGSAVAGVLLSSGMVGCAKSSNASAPGELELVLAGGAAPFAIEGRVRLVPVDSSDPTAPDVFVDVPERRSLLALPAGVYLLTLNDGARLRCPRDDHDGDELPLASHVVAALPQRLAIAPGTRTTAWLGFGGGGSRHASGQAGSLASGDPCAGHVVAPSSAVALSGAPAPSVDADGVP
jgi:hypothetical protein